VILRTASLIPAAHTICFITGVGQFVYQAATTPGDVGPFPQLLVWIFTAPLVIVITVALMAMAAVRLFNHERDDPAKALWMLFVVLVPLVALPVFFFRKVQVEKHDVHR